MADFISILEQDINQRHLSTHPFYQLWNEGKVSMEALQEYTKEYYQFVQLFPRLVSRVHSNTPDEADRLLILENLNEEENPTKPHTLLWKHFAEGLGIPAEELVKEPLPTTLSMLGTMKALCDRDFVTGCAALLAYEAQISEIAVLKQKGLEKHYNMHDPKHLEFFEEHGVVDIEHQKTWKKIIAKHATTEIQQRQVRIALNEALEAQWKLLDGIHKEYCET